MREYFTDIMIARQEISNRMEKYKQEFIEFMIDCEVLKFGDFVTKSGRKTPFFVNTGFYRTGAQLRRLGGYYARAIHDKTGLDFDVLFGPAYKGIPLTVAATIAISEQYGKDIRYCSNRKEVKDHGDKGILLGSPIKDGDRVVIIEDVTSCGIWGQATAWSGVLKIRTVSCGILSGSEYIPA